MEWRQLVGCFHDESLSVQDVSMIGRTQAHLGGGCH